MTNEEAIKVLGGMRNLLTDQDGRPTSDVWYALGTAIEALSAQPEQRWTPCSEGLPKKTDLYLVTVKDWNIPQRTDFFNSHKKWDTFGDRVIAWQPLPEPYKET